MPENLLKVRITSRNFTLDQKIYGAGGEYTVNERQARYMVNNNKAVIIEGELSKEDPFTVEASKQFLSMVRANIGTIFEMLEEEGRTRYNTGEVTGGQENDQETSSPENEGSQSTSEAANGTISSETGSSAGTGDSSEDGGTTQEIPDDFPGRSVLAKAGITRLDQIPTSKDELMKIDQMTGRLANQIGIKLNPEA